MWAYQLDVKFKIGQIVYLKTDEDKHLYIVLGYTVRESQIKYILKSNDFEGEFLQMEIDENNLGISAN